MKDDHVIKVAASEAQTLQLFCPKQDKTFCKVENDTELYFCYSVCIKILSVHLTRWLALLLLKIDWRD